VFFLLSALAMGIFIQAGGAFSSDLGGDPDEAAHAVTALMVRDYLMEGLGWPPMKFARTYYDDFPRVALGHYPPLYYLLAAPPLMPQPSVKVLLVLQALTLAGLATLTYVIGGRMLSRPLAAAAGLGLLALPVALKLALHVMSDILLALFCLWAALLWAWYLRAPSVRRALVWGCVAAAAILTKGSGMGLCLLPPLGTLLARRWRLVFSWSWWCAALPVALLAGPWMLYSAKISQEGMTQLSPAQYFLEAVPFHLKALPTVFGWPLTVFATLGLIAAVVAACRRKLSLSPEAASLAAMFCGILLVLLLVPVGLSTRYMLTLAPPVMLLAAAWLNAFSVAQCMKAVVMLVASFAALYQAGAIPCKEVHGFTSAVARSQTTAPDNAKDHWLVASDPRGEGAIIAAAAFGLNKRAPSPLRVLRGSKILSTSDWMGRGYTLTAKTEAEMLALLDKENVTRVFVDLSLPEPQRPAHLQLLLSTMQSGDPRWKPSFEEPVTRDARKKGTLLVYQRS